MPSFGKVLAFYILGSMREDWKKGQTACKKPELPLSLHLLLRAVVVVLNGK
jgi:hypothetical protein